MAEDSELVAKILRLQNRLDSQNVLQNVSNRSASKHSSFPNIHSGPSYQYQPYPSGPGRRPAKTLKWMSEEQKEAKLERRKRYEARLHQGGESEVSKNLQGIKQPCSLPQTSVMAHLTPTHIVKVHNMPFKVANQGSKLVKVIDDDPVIEKTPKEAVVNGARFKRSKHGNLIRINAFQSRPKTTLCRRYTSTGSCAKGQRCAGLHDAHKIAVCPSVLRGTVCSAGGNCDLNHSLSPETRPSCTHYLRGRCTKENCPYSHANVDSYALLCQNFAYLGYCQKGLDCQLRHLRECPVYTNDGRCTEFPCTLPHVDRASQMRKRLTNKTDAYDSLHVDDVSSEEEFCHDLDSDDLDSGDFGEPPKPILGVESGQFTQQHDFVGFT